MAVQIQWQENSRQQKHLQPMFLRRVNGDLIQKQCVRKIFHSLPGMWLPEEGEEPEVQNLLPAGILNMFLDQVNDSVLPSRWGSMWRYAAGLYLAHFAAMYLKTYSRDCPVQSQQLAKAQPAGVIKSATMGDTTVSYDNSAVTIGTEKWGSWNATQYGQQLATLARQVGMGTYVI